MEDLKITHSLPKSSHDIEWYIGKQTKLSYILNGVHDIEVTLKYGWEKQDFMEAICESFSAVFIASGEEPESVHITKLEEDITALN